MLLKIKGLDEFKQLVAIANQRLEDLNYIMDDISDFEFDWEVDFEDEEDKETITTYDSHD